MADEQLAAELDLDISAALTNVEDLGAALEQALAASSTVDLTINADPSEAEAAVADVTAAAEGAAVDIPVTADTSEAQDSLNALDNSLQDAGNNATDLSVSMDSAGSSAQESSGHFNELGGAATGIGTAMALAEGNTSGLASKLEGLGGSFGPVATAGVAAGAALGVFFDAGLKAQTATDRLNVVFGHFKEQVETIDVGGLSGKVEDLAVKAGSTGVGLQLVAANLGQIAQAGGQTQEQSSKLAQEFEALTLKASALNPTLGGADEAAQRLMTALLSGRDKALAPFALGLDAASIKSEALSLGLAKAGETITPVEKLVAGLTLATQKAGDTLGEQFGKGTEQAATKARALRAELEQTIEKLGTPLVAPLLAVGAQLVPVAEAFGQLAATLLTALLPAIEDATSLIGPFNTVLKATGDILSALSPLIAPLVEGFIALKAVEVAGSALTAISTGLLNVAVAAPVAQDAILGVAGGFETAGVGISGFAAAIGAAALPVAAVAAVIAGVALGLNALFSSSQSLNIGLKELSSDSTAKFSQALAEAKTKLDDLHTASQETGNTGVRALGQTFTGTSELNKQFNDVLDKSPQFAQKFINAAQEAGINTDRWRAQLEQHTNKLAEAQVATDAYQAKVAATAAAQKDAATTETTAAQALQAFTSGTGDAASAVSALSAADTDLKNSMDLLLGNFISQEQAQLNFADSTKKLNDQLVATGFTLSGLTPVGQANAKLLLDNATSAEQYSEAIFKATGNVADSVVPLQSYRDELQKIHDVQVATGQDTGFVDSLIAKVDGAIAAAKAKEPEAQQAGSDFGTAYATGIDTSSPQAVTAASTVANSAAIAAGFAVPTFTQQGSDSGAAYGQGITAGGAQSATAAQTVANSAAIAAGFAVPTFYGVGGQFSTGMAGGIGAPEFAGQVTAAATSVAQAAVAAAKSALHIFSPSQVTHDEIGLPFAQGIAAGITTGKPIVTSAATGLFDVRGATSSFTTGATGPGGGVFLSEASIQQLADAINRKAGGAPGGRGTGIFIQNAVFGSEGAAADVDFWARVTTAKV